MTAHAAGCICAGCEARDRLLRAAVIERDQARADLRKAIEEREALRAQVERLNADRFDLDHQVLAATEERDRLRAVLAALELVIGEIREAGEVDGHWAGVADAFDAALRARAGEETP